MENDALRFQEATLAENLDYQIFAFYGILLGDIWRRFASLNSQAVVPYYDICHTSNCDKQWKKLSNAWLRHKAKNKAQIVEKISMPKCTNQSVQTDILPEVNEDYVTPLKSKVTCTVSPNISTKSIMIPVKSEKQDKKHEISPKQNISSIGVYYSPQRDKISLENGQSLAEVRL